MSVNLPKNLIDQHLTATQMTFDALTGEISTTTSQRHGEVQHLSFLSNSSKSHQGGEKSYDQIILILWWSCCIFWFETNLLNFHHINLDLYRNIYKCVHINMIFIHVYTNIFVSILPLYMSQKNKNLACFAGRHVLNPHIVMWSCYKLVQVFVS